MSADRDRAPTFALFCTIDGGCWWIAEVADEIEAVRAYSAHVAEYPETDHSPHIHMEPMRCDWTVESFVDRSDLDPDRNLFRRPAGRAS